MGTRRLLRATGTLVMGVALLAAGCSSGESDTAGPDASPSSPARSGSGSATVLKPLPAAIPASLKRYYGQRLRWQKCSVPGFQCASLRVPLDYAHPDPGAEVKLAVTRKRAERSDQRLGSLMINPGGPGGSAIDYVQGFAGLSYPESVRARYDLVGMDPRGVARSEPITCLTGRQMDAHTQVDETPDDHAEQRAVVAADEKFARGCQRHTGKLIGHVSTIEVARDMDVLREVLGDRKLTYVGASYGTFLGATYAGLYPTRVGRFVLDGGMDPSLSGFQLNRDQTAGFETAFTAFAEDCVRASDCPLGRKSPKDAGQRLSAFFQRLDAKPVATGESRKLGEALSTIAVISAMYQEDAWPHLRTALREAMAGDGAALLQMADSYYERREDGEYGNIMYANAAVNCLDLPATFRGPADVTKAVPSFEKASPIFGKSFAWAALVCGSWPLKPTGRPHVVKAEGAAPILVVGTTRDPATPYGWSKSLASQLSSGVLLTYEGDGHTAYRRGSDCVDAKIDTYLLEGKAPKDGTTCS